MRPYRLIALGIATLLMIATIPALSISDRQIIYRSINTPDDIVDIKSNKVWPIAYTNTVSLASLDTDTRKQKFFEMLLPAILISKAKLGDVREYALGLLRKRRLSSSDEEWLDGLKSFYRTDDPAELLLRLNDHPVSIVLAQAAIETGWGTSRFFREANNVFGIRSYDPDEPRMRARETPDHRAVYVKKYKSLIGAVDDYFITIARGPYPEFRKTRASVDDVHELVKHLHGYSEIGNEYVRRVRAVIAANDLSKYDDYVLTGYRWSRY